MAEKKLTFEQSMERLNEIVSLLEENEKPLDETIALFEEGLKLVRSCDQKLKQFENRINDIIQKNGGDEDAD
ncbi:MAG: exodeoxyribonuclease VII small subunit [Solobacterium sp.]|nr:exodeoxyribonuclease VII small subunit [Solobacterium sp.]